jgi:Glycosyl transferase family 90
MTQGTPSTCATQQEFFHPSGPISPLTQYQHRFLMDLDGNTFSGRFYNHLRSNSLSLKMTVFKEWHDDRLRPWVHYVPVSLEMGELPELVRWFATTERGEAVGRNVAGMGAEAWRIGLRAEDMQVYVYRLFLETARLIDPERKLMAVKGMDRR